MIISLPSFNGFPFSLEYTSKIQHNLDSDCFLLLFFLLLPGICCSEQTGHTYAILASLPKTQNVSFSLQHSHPTSDSLLLHPDTPTGSYFPDQLLFTLQSSA